MNRVLLGLVLSGCTLSESAPEMEPISERYAEMSVDADSAPLEKEFTRADYGGVSAGVLGGVGSSVFIRGTKKALLAKSDSRSRPGGAAEKSEKPADAPETKPTGDQAALRQWFPEAFLWRPSVQTDADGVALLHVQVPDQLTTWRVLALAHDPRGQQTGSEHTFDSTLPAYVDPVVPGWAFVGDRFLLPVQVVNNGSAALNGALTVDLTGAMTGGSSSSFSLAGFGSRSTVVPVEAVSAGTGTLHADLAGVDQVKKQWRVTPTGRPIVEQQGGTLSGERRLKLQWPKGADPRTAKLSVEVQPGPLAVLTAELERLDDGGAWHLAYAYGVLDSVKQLSAVAGVELDEGRMDRVRKRAWQRLVKRARSPSALLAGDLLSGLGPVQPDSLESTLKARLVRTLVQGQRGDGTWAHHSRATLQAVLVTTAAAARVLPEDQTGPRLRASGALERFEPNIDDPFTASVVIASGLLTPSEPTLKMLMSGLVPVDKRVPDGAKTVRAPRAVRDAYGGYPSRDQARAWMALALLQLPDDAHRRVLAGDLASEIMTTYSGSTGFGSRNADGVLLEAVVAALPTVGDPIQLELELNGQVVGTASVDPKQPGVMAVMRVPTPGVDPGELVLRSVPAAAGLAYTITQHAWVPWTGRESLPGVDLEVTQSDLRAGTKGSLTFTIAAPSGASVTLVQGLPSGMVVHEVKKLRALPGIHSVEVEQHQIELTTTPFGAGEIRTIEIPVIPRYAGRMRTAPLELSSANRSALLPPHVWVVD